MTQVPNKLPFADLFTRGRDAAARSDIEWESVMVQITLAFVIILGYLISKGVTESQDLAAESARQRQQNQLLEKIVADFSATEAGEERAQRIAAQRETQAMRLINAWLRIRDERLFRRLVQQYRQAELVPLSDDLKSLPAASSFQELNAEIDRIFLSEKGDVSRDELDQLVADVLTAEGFDPEAPEPEGLAPDVDKQYDNPRALTLDNLNMLKAHIIGDLTEERRELVQIQYALVERIAAARFDKLLVLPLGTEADLAIDVNQPDLGRAVREHILEELRTEVRLLPEAADIIRGGPAPSADGTQPAKEQP